MLSKEELFVLTVEDLRSKIDNGSAYNLIRACGLCRHLITDQQPLMYLANKNHKLKILFHVADYSDIPIYYFGYNSSLFNIVWSTINPEFTTPKSKLVERDEFLEIILLKYNQYHYTVKDIIRAASHFMGGVHSRKPGDGKEAALSALDKAASTNERLTFNAIKTTCKVVLKAMEPLEQSIKRLNSVGEFSPYS